jgi:hypothetical protein
MTPLVSVIDVNVSKGYVLVLTVLHVILAIVVMPAAAL